MSHGQLPYGDIFSAATPALDRLSQQIYAEHKQSEANRQQQIAAMDNEFSKNVAGVRDADVGDITKAYGDWKTATQGLMKKKNATPEEQLAALRKKAEMYKILNDSKAEKDREEMVAKRYVVKPDDFNDNAGELIIKGRQLPLSQKRSYTTKDANGKEVVIDLSNPENLLYQDKTDWQKILGKAEGTLGQRGTPVEEAVPGGLQNKVTTYKAKNSPIDYYQSVVGSMTTAKAAESLANRYKFSPEEAQVITDEFNQLKETPAFKNTYGKVDFPESSNLTEGLRTAKLLAMQHAIHNQPTANAPVYKDNKEAIMNKQQANALTRQSIGFNNSMAKMREYFNRVDASEVNITKKAEELNKAIDGTVDANGLINMDADWKKKVFGTATGEVRKNASGDYERVVNNGTDEAPVWEVKDTKPKDAVGYIIRGEVQKNAAKHTSDVPKPTGKKPTYQGLDKNGNPIFK